MKTFLITLGVIAVIGGVFLVFAVVKVTKAIRQAHGHALYSGAGAWKRISEFAHAEGKSNYIAEADSKLAMLESDLKAWREAAGTGADFSAFEKMRETAYATTDQNIKNGQNPLAYLDTMASAGGTNTPAGLNKYEYLACDGGPHLVLPAELSNQWKGAGSLLAAVNPNSDYGRACSAVANQRMELLTVGGGQAMVLADPPLSAWGRSPEDWIDIYFLDGWSDTNTDALVERAVAATPTAVMNDTGKMMTLKKPGLILLFAGDQPGKTAYGESAIPIAAGSYQILEGHYKAGVNEIYIYRFKPQGR